MKVYAVSDLHGCLDLYKQIKEFIQPEDKVYFLGDAGDRGPQSWETIKAIYEDPQFVYLKGNHEDMFVRAATEWIDSEHRHGHDYSLLCHNGGEKTFRDWKNGPERNKWLAKIARLPLREEYVNAQGQKVLLSHAGLHPQGQEDFAWGDDLLWDRNHFFWAWEGDEDMVVVHGHTPFCYLSEDAYDVEAPQCEEMPEDEPIHAIWYCEHHKVGIDCGAFFTGQTLLLDLDTWEEHYFYVEE